MILVLNLARHTTAVNTAVPSTDNSRLTQQAQQNGSLAASTPSGVYVAAGDSIYRLDVRTGKIIWKYNLPGSTQPNFQATLSLSSVIPTGNTIYAAANTSSVSAKPSVLALDAANGKVRWSYQFTNADLVTLFVSDSVVYAGTNPSTQKVTENSNGSVYALNAADGMLRTKYHIAGAVSQLTAAKNRLYIAASDGLDAINLTDGKPLWHKGIKSDSPQRSLIITTPHVVDGLLYTAIVNDNEAGPTDSYVAAFDITNGKTVWQSPRAQGQVFDLVVANNVVYFGTTIAGVGPFQGTLYAYEARKGNQLWKYAAGGAIQWAPYATDGVVYASAYVHMDAPEVVAAVNTADGHEKWKIHVGAGLMTTPYVHNGVVYVASGFGSNTFVYALKAADGSQLWKTALGGDPASMAVV